MVVIIYKYHYIPKYIYFELFLIGSYQYQLIKIN